MQNQRERRDNRRIDAFWSVNGVFVLSVACFFSQYPIPSYFPQKKLLKPSDGFPREVIPFWPCNNEQTPQIICEKSPNQNTQVAASIKYMRRLSLSEIVTVSPIYAHVYTYAYINETLSLINANNSVCGVLYSFLVLGKEQYSWDTRKTASAIDKHHIKLLGVSDFDMAASRKFAITRLDMRDVRFPTRRFIPFHHM